MRYLLHLISIFFKLLWRFRLELVLFLLIIPAFQDLLRPGFFPMHDDLQVFRLFEVDKCVRDGQFPCRWVPDAGFGYGYPLMQFYPPMPYYPMELMVLLGFGFFWPVKIIFALAFVFSALGMYLLGKEFFGKWGGVIASVLYVYSPYHSVDIYVRGALNEAWGMVWFPFVLLYIYRLIINSHSRPASRQGGPDRESKSSSLRGGTLTWQSIKIFQSPKTDFILLSIAIALQISSHNVMTMVFAPSAILWALFWLWRSKKILPLRDLILSGVLGVGLAAFFFIPVVLEQKFVHVDSMMVGYFNYLAHFADIKQLFTSRFWGYGGSTWGPEDGMSFSIGHVQWIAALLATGIAVCRLSFLRKQESIKFHSINLMIIMTVIFGFVYAFLSHGRSVEIWKVIPLLQYAQFPWRLVALIVFYFSFASGYLATLSFPKFTKPFLFSFLIIGTIVFNLPFFKVERHTRVTLGEKLSGLSWENQVTGGIFDYLPRSAPKPPGAPAFTIPVFPEGQGGILNYRSGTNWLNFDVNISSASAKVMLPLYTFPGLVTKVDGRKVKTEIDEDLGRVIVNVTQGIHHVEAKIGYTAVRLFSDLFTLLSLLILIKLIAHDRKRPA